MPIKKDGTDMLPPALFTTNRLPTDEERATIEEYLTKSDAQSKDVQEEISEHVNRLQILYDQKMAIIAAAAPHKQALAPFRSLPEDVIREICLACLDTNPRSTISRTQAPIILTQISSGIRRIALTTPALWASIHIGLDAFRRPPVNKVISRMRKHVEEIREWILRRSGNLPLRILMSDIEKPFSSFLTAIADEIVGVLLSCCSRWKHISFEFIPFPSSRIDALSNAHVPLLQSLVLRIGAGGLPFNSKLLRAPKLKELTLFVMEENLMGEDSVCWANLTHFTLAGYLWQPHNTTNPITHILGQATRLVACNLDLRLLSEVTFLSEIYLPSLKVLSVIEMLQADDLGILGFINAPVLQKLMIAGHDSFPRTASLTSLLKRSPNIEEIYLENSPSLTRIVTYLRHCPSLKTLRIQDVRDKRVCADVFLDVFVLDKERERICSQLEIFQCLTNLNMSVDAVERFYTRKQGNIPGLSHWKDVDLRVQSECAGASEVKALIAKKTMEGGLMSSLSTVN